MDKTYQMIEKLLEQIEQLKQIIVKQGGIIEQQNIIMIKQNEKIEELEKRLNKNSSNSSKPPSTDSFKKKSHKNNSREKTDKTTGGQIGHKGRTLIASEKPEVIIDLTIESCEACNQDLRKIEAFDTERRQVHDIPLIKIEVTEYCVNKKKCTCGHVNIAEFPDNVDSRVQYGNRIKGFALYLHNEQKLPYERSCQLLNNYYGTSFSEGSLFNAQEQAYQQLADIEEQIKIELMKAPVLHCDETGMRVDNKLHWFHVMSQEHLTFYAMHRNRGTKAINDIDLIPNFAGIMVHDHWQSYYTYTKSKHALCNAHHLRELKSFEQIGQIWSKDMRVFLQESCHLVNEEKRKNKKSLNSSVYKEIQKKYREILKKGNQELPIAMQVLGKRGRVKQPAGRNLLNRLRDFEDDVLRFASNFEVPFTNNQAERDLRMIKLKQKISGCFRSVNGGLMFARISGYISTIRKQGFNIAEGFSLLASGQPLIPIFSTPEQ